MPNLNATLLASVNGGAPTTGGITAALDDEVQFSFLNTTGWSGARLELSAPPGYPTPTGWTSSTVDGHTVFYVLGRTAPQPVTLSLWGKYMTRLIVNGGAAVDEATAISVPSPSGLLDLGHREAGQFGGSAEKWAKHQRANLRIIEAGLGGGGGGVTSVVGSGEIVAEETGGEVTVSSPLLETLRTQEIRVHKEHSDTAAGDETVEYPICGVFTGQWRFVGAKFYPRSGVAANATNYATLSVRVRQVFDGSALTYAAIGSTTPSGSNSTGTWTAFLPATLTLQEFMAELPLDENYYLSFSLTKVGTGVIMPAGVLVITLEPWEEGS
jgi:hypothetical protein